MCSHREKRQIFILIICHCHSHFSFQIPDGASKQACYFSTFAHQNVDGTFVTMSQPMHYIAGQPPRLVMLKNGDSSDLSANNLITVRGDKIFFGHMLSMDHVVDLAFVDELTRPVKTTSAPKRNLKKAVFATFKGTSPSK